jgi:hypothetical protein
MGFRGIGRGVWKGAEGRHVSSGKLSPVGEHRRQLGANFARSELEKAVTGASRERVFEPPSETRVQGGPLIHWT